VQFLPLGVLLRKTARRPNVLAMSGHFIDRTGVMSFQKSQSTDPLVIVGPRDTEFTRSDLPTIPPVSLKRGWVRRGDRDSSQVPSSARKERVTGSNSRARP
jgi:hypothetical protein